MGTFADSGLELMSTPDRERKRPIALPLLAALALALFGFLAVALAGARPLTAAAPTISPFTQGRHIYDYGKILSSQSATTAEALAAHIEAAGGGRVVLYTADQASSLPDSATLAAAWQVDGLLIAGQDREGDMILGSTLKAKLSTEASKVVNDFSTPGPQTIESWMMSTLARVDALISGTHVFDGVGALDASGKQQAESAAKDLSSQLGAPVYIDIAIGGGDPSTAAFFNGASLSSDFSKALVISLAVDDKQIGGYLDSSSDLWDSYVSKSPWTSSTLENQAAANGDVQAALLAAIAAVQKPPLIPAGAIPVIIFVVVIVIFSITAPFLWGPRLIRKLSGTTGPIKGGLPGEAVIESIANTGVTVTMSGVGSYAPDYKFTLQVTPSGGGAPYQVVTKALVPRLYIPMVVPGATVGVLIDPTDPMKVSLDFSRMGGGSAPAAPSFAPPGGFSMNFDANGQPSAGDIASLAGGVRSGSANQIKGSADHILATGAHGTAVITSAQPLGRTVRDVNPAADPSRLNDPIWLFTLEVTLPGQQPFPAVFGHRVPLAEVVSVFPGVKLAVAVNEADHSECAIDWDRSPIA